MLLVILIIGIVVRAFLPWAVRDYVNRVLDRNRNYSGTIGQVQIHLLRGAYSIQNVRISKSTADVPVPFFSAQRLDFAIQWNALFHRKVVGRVLMQEPQINFVAASDESEAQTGANAPWLQMIRDLFPFQINQAIIQDGSVHYRFFESQKPVDVYISQLQGSIDNLGNIDRELNPLVATVQAKGKVMDQANVEIKMTLNPFSYRPTFHLALRLIGLDVTKINDLTLTYGKFDFKRGWFDLVIDVDSKEGTMTGYVKPLFRNLKAFSLPEDVKQDNPLQFFWQALVGGMTTLLKNQPRDQFGTLIPFTADASGATSTDILATIGNILRNAFVRAYLPRLENGQELEDQLHFDAPTFTEDLSTASASQPQEQPYDFTTQ